MMVTCKYCCGSGRDMFKPSQTCFMCRGHGQIWVSDPGPGGDPPGPGIVLTGQVACFVAAGLIMLGLRIAPDQGAPGEAWIIPGMLLAIGAFGLIKGLRESGDMEMPCFLKDRLGHPRIRRLVWFFRLRGWMIAWFVAFLVMLTIGTPHLRITYNNSLSHCTYFGLNGWVETRDATMKCALFDFFPLRFD